MSRRSVPLGLVILPGGTTIRLLAPFLQRSMLWLPVGVVGASLTSLTLWGISSRRR